MELRRPFEIVKPVTKAKNKTGKLQSPFEIIDNRRNVIPVDEWVPGPGEEIFRSINGFIIIPVADVSGISPNNEIYNVFNSFNIIKKRCYNGEKVREHICHYMNYFLKFYDTDREMIMIYNRLKYFMDIETEFYTEEAFMSDIKRYLLSPGLRWKVKQMNEDNYCMKLSYTNNDNKALEYNDKHGKILMECSIFMNMIIPAMIHYIYKKNINETKAFILRVFDMLIDTFDADIYNKLYETSKSTSEKNYNIHKTLWDKQDIRGKNLTTHSLDSIENIILNIMPKYRYDQNIVNFNYRSIIRTTGYQVTAIGYEFNFISLSASNRDDENNSEFDKFESHLTKQDESLYMQNVVNSQKTMEVIENRFGPFNDDEIDFYLERVNIGNAFQKELVLNLFHKFFGDPNSIKAIDNKIEYIKLVIAAKNLLLSNNFKILPYVLSGEIIKQVDRKSINKKEHMKLTKSIYWQQIKDKYKNEKIEKTILSMMASILSSEFKIVDYYDQSIDGDNLIIYSDLLGEELLMYVLMI